MKRRKKKKPKTALLGNLLSPESVLSTEGSEMNVGQILPSGNLLPSTKVILFFQIPHPNHYLVVVKN